MILIDARVLYTVVSYQPELRDEDFRVWTLQRYEDSTAKGEYTNGNGKQCKKQLIKYTDIKTTTPHCTSNWSGFFPWRSI